MKRSVWCVLLGSCVCLQLCAMGSRAVDRALADLLDSCHEGDCRTVQACLLANHLLARQVLTAADLSENGYTVLYMAAVGGYVEIIRLLLEAGADLERN